MKLLNILIIIILAAVTFTSCEKVENEMPDVKFSAGSLIYKVNDTTFYKMDADKLYKCSPSDTAIFSYSLDNNTLTSSELTIELFSAVDFLFPAQNDIIYTLTGRDMSFLVEGVADGIAIYYGDSTKSEIHKYEDFPYAQGTLFVMDTETNTGVNIYRYRDADTCSVTMVARNFWETDAEAKEQNEHLTVIVLDRDEYGYLK